MTADQVATDIYQKSGLFQVLQQEHGIDYPKHSS